MVKSLRNTTKTSEITPFGLRLQPELKRRLEEAAKANGHSLNNEIANRLGASLESDDAHQKMQGQVHELREDVNELKAEVKTLRKFVNLLMD